MACTRSRSKIWYECLVLIFLIEAFTLTRLGWSGFASQFSLRIGESYSDNILFTRDRKSDFVTVIVPTLSIFYAPEGYVEPILNVNISPSAQLFARHSELNNFGDDISVNGGYTYDYSPRLKFYLSDTFRRLGRARTPGSEGPEASRAPAGPVTSPPPSGSIAEQPLWQDLSGFVSRGDQISNSFIFQGSYLYRPDVSFLGRYTHTYVGFLDQGGSESFHTIGSRAVYNWRRDHNLHAGYAIALGRLRNGDTSVIHHFDIGNDYFTDYKLPLTPTLSLAASTGLSVNASGVGPYVASNTNVAVIKLWETASLTAGVRKGLTPSFGISGVSDTTSFYSNFIFHFSDKLSLGSGVNLSLFDTRDVNFKTFNASAGLQYLLAPWLSSALEYHFRWSDVGAGAVRTDLLSRGTVTSNTVMFTLTFRFDLWPQTGLARTMIAPGRPVLMTPFPDPVPGPSA